MNDKECLNYLEQLCLAYRSLNGEQTPRFKTSKGHCQCSYSTSKEELIKQQTHTNCPYLNTKENEFITLMIKGVPTNIFVYKCNWKK